MAAVKEKMSATKIGISSFGVVVVMAARLEECDCNSGAVTGYDGDAAYGRKREEMVMCGR